MDQLIGYCGLDCVECDARKATVGNDDELRRKTARKWCEWNQTDQILPEHINCMGCRADGVKTPYCESMCNIRKCAISRGVETCADCGDKAECTTLAPIVQTNETARGNIL